MKSYQLAEEANCTVVVLNEQMQLTDAELMRFSVIPRSPAAVCPTHYALLYILVFAVVCYVQGALVWMKTLSQL